MARFDLYRVDGTNYLDVQTNILPSLGYRLVVPMLPTKTVPAPIRRLHPVFEVGGQRLVMATHLMVSVPERHLGTPVGNLLRHYDEIVDAIGMVFNGF